jgi:hypothetical protein
MLKSIRDYKKQHPNATDQQAMQHVMKFKVPCTVEGAPQWYRTQLSDLLAMVQHWGMPSIFLTLTAGDKPNGPGKVQWSEVRCDCGDTMPLL